MEFGERFVFSMFGIALRLGNGKGCVHEVQLIYSNMVIPFCLPMPRLPPQHWVMHSLRALQHYKPNPARNVLFQLVPLVDTSVDRIRLIVEEVVMELAIARAELLLLQEERVVHQ